MDAIREFAGQYFTQFVDFFRVGNKLFFIGTQGVSALELISVVTGLLCVMFAARGKVLNFWIGYLYNILLFFLFLQQRMYSSMILQPISLFINFYGHYRWTHPKEDERDEKNKLKVTVYNNGQRTVAVAVVLIFTFVWGYILSRIDFWWPAVFHLPATFPYFDAFGLGLVLMAQLLSAKKKLDCWGFWLIANTSNIILCSRAGLGFMPLVYAAYLILAAGGFYAWLKMYRKQRMADLKKEAVNDVTFQSELKEDHSTKEDK